MQSRSSTSNSEREKASFSVRTDPRARRALLWCLIGLCLSLLPGGWLIDHCPYDIRNPAAASRAALWEKADPPFNVLILGSSRLGTFLRTSELQEIVGRFSGAESSAHVLDATFEAGEPITIDSLTRKLLASGAPPPRLVLLETSPDLLSRNNAYFSYVITRELVAADLPQYIGEISLSSVAVWRLISSRVAPFFLYREEFLTWASDLVRQKFIKGPSRTDRIAAAAKTLSFQPWRDSGEKSSIAFSVRMQLGTDRFRSRLEHYDLSGHTPAALENTIARLRAKGCAVVLVQPPLSAAQRRLFNPDVQKSFGEFLQKLRASYGCEFVDFSSRFPDNLFMDSQHGNNAGSVAFTELLAKEVIAPAWRQLANENANEVGLR